MAGMVILYIEDVDLNVVLSITVSTCAEVILYIEDVDLNGKLLNLLTDVVEVILYIEDVDLNESMYLSHTSHGRHPLH